MALMLNLRQLHIMSVSEGDFAELGVWKGNSAAVLAHFARGSGKGCSFSIHFSGFDSRDLVGTDEAAKFQFTDTSISYVQETISHNEITTYIKGFFPESITFWKLPNASSLGSLPRDCDLYEPMKAALEFFYPRMSKGGMLILHNLIRPASGRE